MAGGFTIKIDATKLAEIQRALIADAKGVTHAMQAGLHNMATDIADESEQLVPVDLNILRGSRTVVEKNSGVKYSATVGYGGNASAYALAQHERLDYWHPPKPPGKNKSGGKSGTGPGIDPATGRGPKYLERPFRKYTENFASTLTAYVRMHYKLGTGKGR